MSLKFTVHCLVKNEDIWVKAAIESVMPYAEKILVFDTGSTDETVEQIKLINSPKIFFEERGIKDRVGLVELRKEMIKKTDTPWFQILDGDEIWPESELKKLIKAAQEADDNIVALVNRNKNCVGDIYHYLPENSGNYQLAGKIGNLTIRMIRKTNDLTIKGEYPLESFANSKGPIQDQDENLFFADCWYLHTSFLVRSSTDKSKKSGSFSRSRIWEKGVKLDKKDLPEVLSTFDKNLGQVKKRGLAYEIGSHVTTPLITLKRKLRSK